METELLTPTAPAWTPLVKRITFEEYLDSLTEESKGDLFDGLLYMQTPPSDAHEEIFGFLFDILRNYVLEKNLGVVRGSRTAIRFAEEHGTQPDIVFISNARRHLIYPYYIDGAPEVVVEILSPSTRKLDRGKKMALYAENGVLEYWQVDPEDQTAKFLRNNDGVWAPMPVGGDGIFHSEAISGFWLNVQWLFTEEPLSGLKIVPTILAGNKRKE